MVPSASRRETRRSPCWQSVRRPCEIEREAIGAGFVAGEGRGAGVAAASPGSVETPLSAFHCMITLRGMSEKSRDFGAGIPERAFRPEQVVGDLFDLGIRRDQRIEALVERFEPRRSGDSAALAFKQTIPPSRARRKQCERASRIAH